MISTEELLAAYAQGFFPMAESRESPEIRWYHPELRGIIPLDAFHVPRSLAKFLKRAPFTLTTNHAFAEVIRGCAERDSTWINATIEQIYIEAHEKGFAHSVECWRGDALVGGLYGISLCGAFFGESMFSRESNASRACLVHLVTLLKSAGYVLLDTQYVNDHLLQFGVQEVPREAYLRQLQAALEIMPEEIF